MSKMWLAAGQFAVIDISECIAITGPSSID